MKIELVNCSDEFWEFIRNLRNDKRVYSGFINNEFITVEMQRLYMLKNNKNYRIALVNGEPAGYVGVIKNDIRICTHPDFQGKGVGKFLLNNCIKIWPNATAKIKINNTASINLFKSCGFIEEFILMKNSKK